MSKVPYRFCTSNWVRTIWCSGVAGKSDEKSTEKWKWGSPWYHSHNQDVLPNLQPLKRMQLARIPSLQPPRTPHTFCFHTSISLPLPPIVHIHPLPQILSTIHHLLPFKFFKEKNNAKQWSYSLKWLVSGHQNCAQSSKTRTHIDLRFQTSV